MLNTLEIFKKSCEKIGLKRVVYTDNNVPVSMENVIIFPFFGNSRSCFILSSILLKRIKKELKSSKYLILLSWPGYETLFPYVDEYWTIEDSSINKIDNNIEDFENKSIYYSILLRSLHEFFYEILSYEDIDKYYKNGLKREFFDRFKHVKVFLPTINSTSSLDVSFVKQLSNKDLKVFVYPSKEIYTWKNGKTHSLKTTKDFWIELCKTLDAEGYYPVVYRDIFSHDISLDFTQTIHIWDKDLSKVLSAIRTTGFVIDFFSGISKMAICARTPFLCFDEKFRYNNTKDYEIDDLCARNIPKQYVFSFATIINSENKNAWKYSLFDSLISRLNKFFPLLNRDLWPSSVESETIVPYDLVRKNKNKKLGTKFIKINREE